MDRNLNALNKWRIDEFRKNNDSRKSPESDFVCTSPKRPNRKIETVFESDSDTEIQHLPTLPKQDNGLYVIKPSAKNMRKRQKLEMKAGLNESDDDIIISAPTTRNAAKKKVKTLPHKRLSANRKTAVVVPMTKRNSQDNDAVITEIVDDKVGLEPHKNDMENLGNHMDTSAVYAVKENGSEKKKSKPHADSDSDLSLFEISFEGKPTKSQPSSVQALRNPPPSPVDITSNYSNTSIDDAPTENLPVLPMESTFSSGDSDTDTSSSKRRGGKGKQPANKRRKVVTKSSKPQQDKVNVEGEDIIRLPETISSAANRTSAHNGVTFANPMALPVTSKTSLTHDKLPTSTATVHREESVNRAVVRPNSSVIVIADEDDEDDVVMLSNTDKNRQELDDLEYARRLQAKFDEENTGGARPKDPERPNTSHRHVTFADSSLPERSTRLLQAVGASPEVTQYIGSRGAQHAGARPPTELDDVERKLELLRELALQGDGVDDATFNEILGNVEPLPSPERQVRPKGPRPPTTASRISRSRSGSDRDSNSRGNNHHATSSRSRVSLHENQILQRALQEMGMATTDDLSYESLLELTDLIGDAREAGVSPEILTQLPCRKYEGGQANQSDPVCRICLSEFEMGEELRTLNCFHEFHSGCIDQWLQKKVTCPNCRERVTLV